MTDHINWNLVESTLAWIEKHPDRWNQHCFMMETVCGTTFCFAGVACMLSGAIDRHIYQNGWVDIAQGLLGFSGEQAEEIFFDFPYNWKEDGPTKFRRFVYDTLGKED